MNCKFSHQWYQLSSHKHNIYIYTCICTIVNLLCKNGFLREILHRRRRLRCEMQWEVHYQQKWSMIVCLSRSCQSDLSDVNITSWFFISYPFSALGHDIWTRADKGYDMKNDMLWSVYHILQQRFPEIQEVTCNKLININRKACSNIPEAKFF
jgi:hypothetical protein